MQPENEQIRKLLRRKRNALYAAAVEIIEPFWAEHYEHRKKADEETGVHSVRAIKGSTGISVLWHRVGFIERKDGGWQALNYAISLGKRTSYQSRDFSRMRPWERKRALEIEAKMDSIRRMLEHAGEY